MPDVESHHEPRRVAVIGGGITGLAAAHRLRELAPGARVTLLEAGSQLGGVLQTTHRDGYLIEHSADNFITNVPWAIDLCRRIGFEEQLIHTDDRFRRAFVAHGGKLRPVPDGFALLAPAKIWPILTTGLLSWRGKLRLAWEYFTPANREIEDESLESFAVRRLGRETFERIVQPLVGGIYTADPKQLSLAATLPRFLEMERTHGGLIRGALRQDAARLKSDGAASGARYSLFVAPRDGMSSLVDTLAKAIPTDSIRINTRVDKIRREASDKWAVHVAGSHDAEMFDHVIVATSAPVASKLLREQDPQLADSLAGIPYAGASVICVGYRREQVNHPLDGFGFVVPAVENRKILAGSFSSVKYAGRAPDGHVLIRVFAGGALQPEVADLPEDELVDLVRKELGELIGATGEPELTHVTRWQGAMPQYHIASPGKWGHLDRVRAIEARVAELPGLQLAGNAFAGVGVPQCIRSGELAAEVVTGASSHRKTRESSIHDSG